MSASTITLLTAWLVPLLLITARLGGLTIFAPIFGSQVLVSRVKVLLVFGLAVAAAPPLIATGAFGGATDLGLGTLAVFMAFEVAIGAVIGFIALMPMIAMQTGGLVMAQQMGLGFARFYNPAMGSEADVLENLLFLLALAIFISLGGIDWSVLAVLNSYSYVSVGSFDVATATGIVSVLSGVVMSAIELGLRIAAPLLALVFLETISIGFISKTVPQLNILSLGFPLRILIGLGTIVGGLVVMQYVLVDYIDVILDTMMNWHRAGGVASG